MDLSRRGFLGGALAAGGALSLAVTFGCGSKAAGRVQHAESTGELTANMYITVMPDGRVALTVNKAEIGQGVATGYATLCAEEIGVPIDHVDVQYAGSNAAMRVSFNMQITGGSTSTKEGFKTVRTAAASAREMLIAAAAGQWKVPAGECTVADGKVMHAASKREAKYGDLTKLAAHESVPSRPKLKAAKDFTLIGKTNNRVDARGKIDGTAIYGIDVRVPGMVNATMIHGPVYGAKPDTIDDAAARKHPGVIDIFATKYGVAVVAEKYWQVLAAARAVKVTWKKGATAGLDTEKLAQAMRAYDAEDGATTYERGNAGKALGKAATKVSAIYEAPYLAHAALEPQNATVSVKGGKAEVWAPTQSPTITQAFVAEAIGADMDDVTVHVTLAGGGFGRRAIADVTAEAAVCSKRVKRPVKLVWSRESDMTQGFYRPIYAIKMDGGLAADGHATALRAHAISQSIALSSKELMGAALPGIPNAMKGMVVDSLLAMFSTSSVGDLFATEGLKDTPYQIPNVEITASPVQTKMPVASWRSVGNSVTGFAAETFIDELAVAAKVGPYMFRRQMVKDGSRQARVLDALVSLSKWDNARAPGIGRGLARHFSFETEVGEVAEVEIVDGRIKVRRVFCVVDCGIAVNPDVVRAQMEGGILFGLSAALDQELTIVDGVVQQRNYDTFPALRMFEAPEIIVQVLDSDEDPTGVGEPGLPPIAAAVGNAIFALTGIRLRRMPLQRALDEAMRSDKRPATVAGGGAR